MKKRKPLDDVEKEIYSKRQMLLDAQNAKN